MILSAASASGLTALWSSSGMFLSQVFLLLTSFLVACRPCTGITIFISCLRVLGWVSCVWDVSPTQLSLIRGLLEDPLPTPQALLQTWRFPFPCLSRPVMRCSVTSLLSFSEIGRSAVFGVGITAFWIKWQTSQAVATSPADRAERLRPFPLRTGHVSFATPSGTHQPCLDLEAKQGWTG